MRRIVSFNGMAFWLALACIALSAASSRAQQMELLETKATTTQTTLNIVGQVKNISRSEVMGVTVYCDLQDANGKSIRVTQGHLDTDPLAPGKISQFRLSAPYSAEIKRFNVTFSQMFGGPLTTKDSRKQ